MSIRDNCHAATPLVAWLLAATFTPVAPLKAQHTDELFEAATKHIEGRRAELIELRRDLHRHPEISGQEERTAGVVAEQIERERERAEDIADELRDAINGPRRRMPPRPTGRITPADALRAPKDVPLGLWLAGLDHREGRPPKPRSARG